ncbi:hypothetical protein P691DRAFT_764734 [Macrolepiota fuliginosa MF-IS2]|uniref:Uncharacterized protein n=1 Tax=Macrolepiota fuliginosa MF-IS2 TaxID=1400762 RepID=A0A9P6BYS2_9AGAR|nr:hypothetical protein P691DRAFT_764734 [Macrolepiota fuliginosa MF-IS2]
MSLLSEQTVQDAFHSYLKSSLTHAKIERLLDADILSSAEGDLMITGPALCLYFAALRCTTNPPSVPLPRSSTKSSSSGSAPIDLSEQNCPPTFKPFLRVWAQTVPSIQSLVPEHQHDLARIICDLPPLSRPPNQSLNGIAAELRAVALEISQRRSFQDRYASDLQAALDAGSVPGSTRNGQSTNGSLRAAFVPPPVYEPEPTTPISVTHSDSASMLSPTSSISRQFPRTPSPSPSPTILSAAAPAIEFIRETMYAALGDTLELFPSLRTLLRTDAPRAYFASVSLAILFVSTRAVDRDNQAIIGVLGAPLSLAQCPAELRPLMLELIGIGEQAREVAEEDDRVAMERVQEGEAMVGEEETRMERVRKILLEGVASEYQRRSAESGERRRSVEGRAVAFANRIGELAVRMTALPAFRARQDVVFQVLGGIGW